MPPLFLRLWSRVRATVAPVPDISATLWLQTLQRYPFLAALSLHDQSKLRAVSALFLHHKEFHGAHGLVVTDSMAIDIAAQACLPLLHWGDPAKALDWYDDFVGIVLHPGEAVARRQTVDEDGVVHEHTQRLPALARRLQGDTHRTRRLRGLVGRLGASVRAVPGACDPGRALWSRTPLAGRLRGHITVRVFCGGLRGVLCQPRAFCTGVSGADAGAGCIFLRACALTPQPSQNPHANWGGPGVLT